MASSKAFFVLGVLLAAVLLVNSDVGAKNVADQENKAMYNRPDTLKGEGVEDAKYRGGGFGGSGGGGWGGPGGGWGGPGGGWGGPGGGWGGSGGGRRCFVNGCCPC